MRTFEHSKTTDHLGRYYTQHSISDLLVQQLPRERPSSVLDLGAGNGALSVAALTKWNEVSLITVDIDKDVSKIITRRIKQGEFRAQHRHLSSDALALNLKAILYQSNIKPPNIAVCNPPFLVPKWRRSYGQILEEAGFSSSLPAITSTDAAALFLAQNLRLLAEGGSLGIIVPDSLVCAEKYLGFREHLLNKYEVAQAIRLQRRSFVGTDALAHILIIKNSPPISDKIQLTCLTSDKHGSLSITVDRCEATRRLDFAYHAAHKRKSKNKLSTILVDLRRGNINSAQVRDARSFILHTTDITNDMRGMWLDFSSKQFSPGIESSKTAVAEPGDIVLARVGRNAAEKVVGIAKGRVALSDCLFRLRVESEHRDLVLRALSSNAGQRWMEMHAYGVAARHLNKSDLLSFPINLA